MSRRRERDGMLVRAGDVSRGYLMRASASEYKRPRSTIPWVE